MILFHKSGFSMIDTMIAMGIATLAFVGVSGAMQNAGNPLKKSNTDVGATTVRQQAIKLLYRYPSWKMTATLNAGLRCAWKSTGCGTLVGNIDFDIYTDSGDKYFAGTDPLYGKKIDGTDCHDFPSTDCPIDIRLSWDLIGPNVSQNQIKINGQLWVYDPVRGTTTERGDLRFSLLKNFYNNSCYFDSTTLQEGDSKIAYLSSTDCAVSQTRTCAMGSLDGSYTNDRCTPCANIKKSGYCWYVGALGQSCDAACATHGGCDLTGTNFHGAAGENDDCVDLMSSLGMGKAFNSRTPTTAMGCYRETSVPNPTQLFIGTDATTCAASSATVYRACACAL